MILISGDSGNAMRIEKSPKAPGNKNVNLFLLVSPRNGLNVHMRIPSTYKIVFRQMHGPSLSIKKHCTS